MLFKTFSSEFLKIYITYVKSYFQVHSITSIAPPIMCGKLVQNYKSKCKYRLSQLKSGNVQNECIVIDEDSK